MRLYGLLITKDDEAIFADWCCAQLGLYDAVVCLDGSRSEATERLARAYPEQLIYLRERDCVLPHKTDHGLRRVVHREIVRRFGPFGWIMCCHVDEFCYHDPRKIAVLAEAEGYEAVYWYSLPFLPHPDDLPDWEHRQHLPLAERIRSYHWGYQGTGLPWREGRLYHCSPRVLWDRCLHGSTLPFHLGPVAPFHPILCHYKVFTTDLQWYEAAGASTHFKGHWEGLEHRSGVAFAVHRPEDLFVRSYPGYAYCDRFDGVFPHSWNMGEQYRSVPPPDATLAPVAGTVGGPSLQE